MSSGLQKLEQRLESAISGVFARAFRSAVQPVEIAAALQRECDNNAQILSRDRRMVPNDFHIELSGSDLSRLAPYDSALANELAAQLDEHARNQSYVFPGPISIEFEDAPDLTIGRFRVRSQAVAAVTGYASATQVRRASAFLEINGTRHPLHDAGLVVGRGTEADLRINDPGVSRRHAEFLVVHPRALGETTQVEVIDLGSTNGMLVNGRKLEQAIVDDGAHIRIGGTDIVVRVLEESGV